MKIRFGLAKPKNLLLITVLLVPIMVYLANFYSTPAKAVSTIGTSDSAAATGTKITQRHVVTSSGGTIVAVYNSGTVAPTGLAFKTSTDNAATWSAGTLINPATDDFSIAIDSSNNVWVAYSDASIGVIKLTFSAGSWTAGATTQVTTNAGCDILIAFADLNPVISVNSAGKIWVSYRQVKMAANTCAVLATNVLTDSSTDNVTWTANTGTITLATGSSVGIPMITKGTALYMIIADIGTNGGVWKDATSSGTWTKALAVTTFPTTGISLASAGSDQLDLLYNSSGIKYQKFTISNSTLAAATTISASSSDVAGTISANSANGNLWAFYQSFVAANSYNIVYKNFNGTSWDSNATSITTDNGNNINISSAESLVSLKMPLEWITGTVSPFTIKGHSLSIAGNSTPAAPTLSSPSNGATGLTTDPQFQMKTTDAEGDYLKYKIDVCSDSLCGAIVRTIDQTASQTGWIGQDANSGAAYVGNSVIGSSTTAKHTYQAPRLKGNTQYWWRAYAIDPAGSNTFSSASSIFSFTTQPVNINVQPGITISPGTTIQP